MACHFLLTDGEHSANIILAVSTVLAPILSPAVAELGLITEGVPAPSSSRRPPPGCAPPGPCLLQGRLVVGNSGEEKHVGQVTQEVEEEFGD